MDKAEILKPLKDLNKGLTGLSSMLNKLKDELPNQVTKEEAEKVALEIEESGIFERVEEMQTRINKLR